MRYCETISATPISSDIGFGVSQCEEIGCEIILEKAPTSYRAVSGPSGPKSQKSPKKESPGPFSLFEA